MIFNYLLIIIIIPRLFFLFQDNPINIRKTVYSIILQIIPVLFLQNNFAVISLIITLIIFQLIYYFIEKKTKSINMWRFLSLLIYLIIIEFYSSSILKIDFNVSAIQFVSNLKNIFPFFQSIELILNYKFLLIFLSVLLLMNESNFFIRILFDLLKINLLTSPQNSLENKKSDIDELKAGRIIGILERIIIFIFIYFDSYGSVGFVLAAKTFARFKKLDDQTFAEYVLIGTLVSSLISICVTLFVKYQLQMFS